jgi:hypothetical protein
MATQPSTNGKASFPKLRKSNVRTENEESIAKDKDLTSSPSLATSQAKNTYRKDRSPSRETSNSTFSQVFIEKANQATHHSRSPLRYKGSMKLQEKSYSPSNRDASKINEHQFIPGVSIKPKVMRSAEKIEERLIKHGINSKLRKQEAANLVNYSFHPSVYSSFDLRDGDTFNNLFKQAEKISEEKRRKAKELDSSYTFKPLINPNSKKLAKNKRFSTPPPSSMLNTESTAASPTVRDFHRRKLTPEQLRAFLERNVYTKEKYLDISQIELVEEQSRYKSPRVNSTSFDQDSIYDRSMVLIKEKEVRIRYKAEMLCSEYLKDCTFKPQISKPKKPKHNQKPKQTKTVFFENEQLKFRNYVKDILIQDLEKFEERVAAFCFTN